MEKKREKIGVLGAGTWGIALAAMLADAGKEVEVWSKIKEEVESLSQTRAHKNLPQRTIPESIAFTDSMEKVCAGKDLLLFAVPSVYVRTTAREAEPFVKKGQLIVDVAKGLEPGTLYTMTEIIDEETKGKAILTALSGPTHAEEVALGLPTMIVSASKDKKAAKKVQEIFSTDFMRVYTNGDVRGVELCGALKNVAALAVGISQGLGMGDNTKAALITRGIVEMSRLGEAMGCDPRTFAGLAGIGDLVVTATSVHSRNNRAGFLIGSGKTVEEAVKEVGMVVEGLNALEGAMALSEKYKVEMPIIEAVNDIVKKKERPSDVVSRLMGRRRKDEFEER